MHYYRKIPYYFQPYYPIQQFTHYPLYQRPEGIWGGHVEGQLSPEIQKLYQKHGTGKKVVVQNPKIITKNVSTPGGLIGREEDRLAIMSWDETPQFKKGTCKQKLGAIWVNSPCLQRRKSQFKLYLVVTRIPLKEAFQKHYEKCIAYCIYFAQAAATAAWEEVVYRLGPEIAAIAAVNAAAAEAWEKFEECMVAFIGIEALKNMVSISSTYEQHHTSDWETVEILPR